MKRMTLQSKLIPLLLAALVSITGCSYSLVKDTTNHKYADASHCSGSEWADDSSLAAVPLPVVAFFMPHYDINDLKADDYLKRCGDTTRLVNREVTVGRGACIPAALTHIITLGIWQWCPSRVSWEADVQS